MNKIFYRIGMVLILQTIFIQTVSYQELPDFDTLLNSLHTASEYQKSGTVTTSKEIVGDADRLIKAMGEVPAKLVEIPTQGWGPFLRRNVWQADPTTKVIGERCDSNGTCDKIYYTVTLQELEKKQKNRLKLLYDYYARIDQPIATLQADIDALKKKADTIKNVNLDQEFKNLLTVARDVQTIFTDFVKKQELELESFNNVLSEFIPSKNSQRLITESLADAQMRLQVAQDAQDSLSVNIYKKVIAQLLAIQNEMARLRREYNLQEALQKAKNLLATYEKSQSESNQKSFNEKIMVFKGVVAAFELELKKEIEEIAKEEQIQIRVDKRIDEIINSHSSAKLAQIEAKDELRNLENKLQRLENLRNPAKKKEIESLQIQIAEMERVIDGLDYKIKEEQNIDKRKDKKVTELIDKLMQKNSFNSSNALAEALMKVGSVGQKSDAKIKAIQDKVDLYQLLTQDEKVVLALNKIVENEKQNDPFNIALLELNTAKTVIDIQKGLENVLAAALGKAGVSIDNLSFTVRQNIANNLKTTSEHLLAVINSPILTEQQKQQQKQIIVKDMLKNNSALLASGITGGSLDALKTGDAVTIATDIALNKLINVLVPAGQTTQNFDLSVLDSASVA